MRPQERTDWRQADRIFAELIELDETERRARMQQLELSPSVGDKLDKLLAQEQTARDWLDQDKGLGTWATTWVAAADTTEPGRKIGDWQLDELIGTGGMASIYRAHLVGRDYEQDAAVKVLHVLLRDPAEEARFRDERRILARLKHPHIATLLDGGIAEDGTPYLAMERVVGERIDDWCDAQGLSQKQRVRLFLDVCSAVAHAHGRLVVHRDLKPGNILVDEGGRVVLLDFGIGSLQDERGLGEPQDARAFTPDYAAPEQREVDGDATDTAVDIFGLGAVLHRMLTGRAPHDEDAKTPRRPSDTGEHVVVEALPEPLDEDLDAILRKALARQPVARYADANSLARDLEAWLDKRPVAARGDSGSYRLGKWVQRHKGVVLGATLLLLVLLGGLAATLWQAQQTKQQAERTATVLAYVENLLADLVPQSGQIELDRSAVLSRASKDAKSYFAQDPVALAQVRMTLARLHTQIGNYQAAATLFELAYRDYRTSFGTDNPQTAIARAGWADVRSRLAKFDQESVEHDFSHAITVLAKHPDQRIELFQVRIQSSVELAESGKTDAAIALLEHNRDTELPDSPRARWLRIDNLSSRAEIYDRLARPKEALPLAAKAIALGRASLAEDDGRLASLLAMRARIYLGMRDVRAIGDLEQALELLHRLYPEGNEITRNAEIHHVAALQFAGRTDEAIVLAERLLTAYRQRLGADHPVVGGVLNTLANLQLQRGHFAQAEHYYRQAMQAAIKNYGPEHAAVAILRANMADAMYEQGELDAALPMRKQSELAICAQFGSDSARCGSQHSGLGRILLALGRASEAEDNFRFALKIYRHEYGDSIAVAVLHAWLAEAERQQGDLTAASDDMESATAVLAKLEQPAPRSAAVIALFRTRLVCTVNPDQCAASARSIAAQVNRFYPATHPFGKLVSAWLAGHVPTDLAAKPENRSAAGRP